MDRFILAPDSFKGTLSAAEVCDILEREISAQYPAADIIKIPMSDGGEGMVESYLGILGGERRCVSVTGPKGLPVSCAYGILPSGEAVAEMAACAGLMLMEGELDPLHATTYGVGELLLHLKKEGVQSVLLGIGGSATNDCGIGMAAALGYRFLDEKGEEVPPYACNLGKIREIIKPACLPGLEITVACDVNNPLCGQHGASAVFGPQKGLLAEQIPVLDNAIRSFAERIREQLGAEVLELPGAGAAGGLGAALVAFCGARLKPGIDMLLDAVGMDRLLEEAELVITGEGRLDGQSTAGKVPVGIGRRAKKAGVPCIAVCGCLGKGADAVFQEGITACYPATDGTKTMEQLLRDCRTDLKTAAQRAIGDYLDQKREG